MVQYVFRRMAEIKRSREGCIERSHEPMLTTTHVYHNYDREYDSLYAEMKRLAPMFAISEVSEMALAAFRMYGPRGIILS